jgi:hypothetical protein
MSEYIDNSAQRKATLKGLVRDLHDGGDVEEIKTRFAKLVGQVSAVEIARLEQELIDEGLPVAEVQRLCDVHVAIFEGGLAGKDAPPEMTPGHPVHTFKYENMAAGELLILLREAVQALPASDALQRARIFGQQLADIEKIYLRKENLLFPYLERHGVKGPSSVMWAQQDEIRAQLKALHSALAQGDASAIRAVFGPLAEAIAAMFHKEETILYPTALKVLSEAEWWAIYEGSDEIGYCLVRPGDQWHPAVAEAAAAYSHDGAQAIPLSTGALTPEQLDLLLTHLPFDVTLVDETDTVRYYSQGPERIFVRTAAIIGRKVQNCHPPQSVHIVTKLLDELKAGTRDSAAFWIHMGEQFVHIRYVALRDAQGQYRGTIEITQEISAIQALTGDRRLLDEA